MRKGKKERNERMRDGREESDGTSMKKIARKISVERKENKKATKGNKVEGEERRKERYVERKGRRSGRGQRKKKRKV